MQTTRPKGGWASLTHLQRQWRWSTCSFSHSYNVHKTTHRIKTTHKMKATKNANTKMKKPKVHVVGRSCSPTSKAMTRSTQTQSMKCKHRNKKAKGKWGWGGGRSCSPPKVTTRSMHSTLCYYNLHKTTGQKGGQCYFAHL